MKQITIHVYLFIAVFLLGGCDLESIKEALEGDEKAVGRELDNRYLPPALPAAMENRYLPPVPFEN